MSLSNVTLEEQISNSCLCTFAVTGANTSFQPIFICQDCFDENADGEKDGPLCICQACADFCHGSLLEEDNNDSVSQTHSHDVDYVGMGPSYCDCNRVGKCKIFSQSQKEADRLIGNARKTTLLPSCENKKLATSHHNVFEIMELHDSSYREELIEQAQTIIKQSKETFWIDSSIDKEKLTCLERLAWKIYKHHMHYCMDENIGEAKGGAEWWIQVKDPLSTDGETGAIDLHYDKDEALAESFGLGFFPLLSTVTYLTAPLSSSEESYNPTLVFDHTYDQGEDEVMNTMLVSHPVIGKHLTFNGTALHGAPAHPSLRTKSFGLVESSPSTQTMNPMRVTFLVNIWESKPAKVQPLPQTIRDSLSSAEYKNEELTMVTKEVTSIELQKDDELPLELRHRIELPFVSKGATWEEQLVTRNEDNVGESDEDVGLVVITYPPPVIEAVHDTILVKFGAGLQAYLDYTNVDEENDDNANDRQTHETAYV